MGYFNNLVVGGTAKFLQDVKIAGLDSAWEELNCLHQEVVTKDGWYILETGDFELDRMPGATGPLGIVVGNSYTFTLTYTDGTVKTETITAIDANTEDSTFPVGTPMIQGYTYEGIVIFDKVSIDADWNVTVGSDHYWAPLSNIDSDLVSVKMTGKKEDGSSITHQTETYNKIPVGHLPDNIFADPPIKQYWEWTNSDANATEDDLGFEKPDGYNRCRILIYDRNITSGGVLGVSMPIIWPIARERGSDTMWYDIDTVGRTLADVKLGNGEGENQTWGGTEWISTVSIDVYFTDKGFMCNYVCGTNSFSGKTVTAGSGYPETYAGQISGVLSEDADIDSILDPSLVWTLGVFLQQNKGNYVEVTWYKD